MDIHKRIENIERNVELITKTLVEIKQELKNINKSCGNMDNHISFIEETYNYIKSLSITSLPSLPSLYPS